MQFHSVLLIVGESGLSQDVVNVFEKVGANVQRFPAGQAGIDRLLRDRHDLVVVDLDSLSEKDVETIKAIRQLPESVSKIPILGVSTSLRREDEDRLLKAGLNALLARPLQFEQLQSILEQVAQTSLPVAEKQSAALRRVTADDETAPVMSRGPALARLGGDEQLLRQLAQFFLEDAPKLLGEIDAGLSAGHARAVHQGAHSLKGLAANFDAFAAMSAAKEIELLARNGNLEACQPLIAPLRQEVARLSQALHAMLDLN